MGQHQTKDKRGENDDIELLEKKLDQLLENGGYQNSWRLPRSSEGKSDDGSKIAAQTESAASQTPTTLELFPLDSDRRLDRQSRFVLELLQTLREVGLTNTIDRVTTERCNAILKRLATPESGTGMGDNDRTKDDSNNGQAGEEKRGSNRASGKPTRSNSNPAGKKDVASVVDQWQRIERARAILESMEAYLPLRQKMSQIPTELPVPSHVTYFTLLKLYSSAKQLSEIEMGRFRAASNPQHNVVLLEAANEAPLTARAIVERMEASGELALVPTSLHWNQVLSCHANAIRRPNRPLEAATLLYKLLQPHDEKGSSITGNNAGQTSSTTDASSFAHALRACADGNALEDYESYRSGAASLSKDYFWKPKETFANLALAVAQRIWKGLQQEQELERDPTTANAPPPTSRRDQLSDLLNGDTTTAVGDVPPSRDTIAMNSHHFVHMLRAARNFATLLSVEQQKRHSEQPSGSVAGRELLELKRRHEEWMRNTFRECASHQKVNIHVLQEVMYQGAVLLYEDGNVDSKEPTATDDKTDAILDWVGRIVLPAPEDSKEQLVARFRSRWETEIVPSLLESRAKTNNESLPSHRGHRSRRRLESVYASTIRQTRILLRCLPSRWIARAD